ncbi:MAG TPA: hypothetical protein DCP32_10280 [Anaerolineaceae bacterium]|nr:hypothetical protein [Anaerolineaceae bacterium]
MELESIKHSSWSKLASHEEINPQRNVRIRVSDQLNQVVKSDLVLPIGLVNTVLHAGGKLSVQLDRFDPQELNKLIAGTAHGQKPQQMIAGDDCIEVTVE